MMILSIYLLPVKTRSASLLIPIGCKRRHSHNMPTHKLKGDPRHITFLYGCVYVSEGMLCVWIYMCVCVYLLVCVRICLCLYLYVYIWAGTHVYLCAGVVNVCICVHARVYVWAIVCICKYLGLCSAGYQ